MPEVICNTSPLQYLHQIGHLELLPKLVSRVIVPAAVADELAEGRRRGLDLPVAAELPWIDLRDPASEKVVRLVADLGPGETGVLLLALERADPLVILDDALARRHAETLPRNPIDGDPRHLAGRQAPRPGGLGDPAGRRSSAYGIPPQRTDPPRRFADGR